MNDPAIAKFEIFPDYASGFVFHWRMRGGFNDPSPWEYRVQMALSQDGEWKDVSPPVVDCMAFRTEGKLLVNKSDILFFRLVCHTPRGEYFTDARTPYGDLDRKEFLIASEIMRKEVLHMRGMAGVECDIWSVSNYGPRCTYCIDPVTGHTRDSHCKYCFGTGFFPAYRGPFRVWCMFSENNQHKLSEAQDGNGMEEEKRFSVRMPSSVPTKKNDILHDVRSGKRYYVAASEVVAELRRVPIVQTLNVNEIATSDAAYQVGARR